MKPILKWVGGKRRLLTQIRELFPSTYNVYHEPFFGGGALFFNLEPKDAHISDSNSRLMTTYLAIKLDVNQVIKNLKQFTYSRKCYDDVKWYSFERGDIYQKAADFIYCNKVGFNGLYRVNQSDKFNVPFGKYTNPNWCDEEALKNASALLQNTIINTQKFSSTLEVAQKGDLVYFDPPYIPLTETSNFTSYTKDGFGLEQQRNLRDIALKIRDKGAHVILSNSSSPTVYELYDKYFTLKEVKSLRSINSNGDKRGAVTELLIY